MSILEVLTGAIILLIIQAVWKALRHSRKAVLREWADATLELLGPEHKAFDPATATSVDRINRWYRCQLDLDPDWAWQIHLGAVHQRAASLWLHEAIESVVLAEIKGSK